MRPTRGSEQFPPQTVQLIEALPAEAYHAEHLPGAGNLPDRVTAEDAAAVAPNRDAPVVLTMAEALKLAAQTYTRDVTKLSCCAT